MSLGSADMLGTYFGHRCDVFHMYWKMLLIVGRVWEYVGNGGDVCGKWLERFGHVWEMLGTCWDKFRIVEI